MVKEESNVLNLKLKLGNPTENLKCKKFNREAKQSTMKNEQMRKWKEENLNLSLHIILPPTTSLSLNLKNEQLTLLLAQCHSCFVANSLGFLLAQGFGFDLESSFVMAQGSLTQCQLNDDHSMPTQ